MAQQVKVFNINDPLTKALQALDEASQAALSASSGATEPDTSIALPYSKWADTTSRTYRQFGDDPTDGSRPLWTLEGGPISIVPVAVSAATYTIPNGLVSGSPLKTWLECNTSSNAITVTLPSSVNTANVLIGVFLKTWDASKDVVTVQRAGSDVIAHPNGTGTETSIVLREQGDILWLLTVGDGVWYIHGATRLAGIVSKSGTDTLLPWERIAKCDASGGAFTLSLPNPAKAIGVPFRVIKTDAGGNAVTVDVDGGANINGSTTDSLASQYSAATYWSDGSAYLKA